MLLVKLQKELKSLSNPDQAKVLSGFFKTKPGQYGANDKFLGLTVPAQRLLAQKYYQDLSLADITKLLSSPYHEDRLTGALVLVAKYQQAKKANNLIEQKKIFNFYFHNSSAFNNWDLVDLTADKIVGDYLWSVIDNKTADQRKVGRKVIEKLLFKLAQSDNLWSRRISIISTFAFIKNNRLADTIKLAEKLLGDKHDLIHKAVGWMLREVGKRDKKILITFLDQHLTRMPRTTLRYAIEKFPPAQRQHYLKK
ncbi:MAG: DNA alkylation repair protein [bacterium]